MSRTSSPFPCFFLPPTSIGGIDSYTKLMLHCDGTNGGTTFTDVCGKTVTPTGVTTSTANKQFGTASALFNNGNYYLSIPDSTDWDFGTGDFTWDWWVKPLGAVNMIYDQFGQRTTNINMFFMRINDDISLYSTTSGVHINCSSSSMTTGWNHIAIVRASGVFKIFINGISQTLTINTNPSGAWGNFTGPLTIGSSADSYVNSSCYMDEIRISKGIARWTANFTPPIAPYSV